MESLMTWFVMLCVAAGGYALTYLFEVARVRLAWRIAAGCALGMALFAQIGFVLASVFGLQNWIVYATALLVVAPCLLAANATRRKRLIEDLRAVKWWKTILSLVIVSIVAWAVCSVVWVERDGNVYTNYDHNIGDLPLHVSIVNSFAKGENFPPEHTEYAGVKLTYPFLIDFAAACLVRLGSDVPQAFFVQNFLLMLCVVWLIKSWGEEFARLGFGAKSKTLTAEAQRKKSKRRDSAVDESSSDESSSVGWLTVALVMLSGGLGWVWFVRGVQSVGLSELNEFLFKLPQNYSLTFDTYRWGNSVVALFVPQRSLLLGVPLFLIIVTLWARTLLRNENDGAKVEAREDVRVSNLKSEISKLKSDADARRMIGAGIIAGLMPLIHAHCFMVVVGASVCLSVLFWKRRKLWLVFALCATLLAVPQLVWAMGGSGINATKFVAFYYGWDSRGRNLAWFWWKNAGVFLPLLIAVLMISLHSHRTKKKSKSWRIESNALKFYLPFACLFLITNVMRLSPWVWDNVKMMFCWFLVSAPLVAFVLVWSWREARGLKFSGWLLLRAGVVLALLSMTAAGALDIWRVWTGAGEQLVFTARHFEIAEMIEANTDARAMVLHAPSHNSPIYLTGRKTFMGYPGHLWTHGLDYKGRERELKAMYENPLESRSLVRERMIDFVLLGEEERRYFKVDEATFSDYELVGEASGYQLYKVR